MFFFFHGGESSNPASEVKSTTGTFPFCTDDAAVALLRFLETGVTRGDASAERSGRSSITLLDFIFVVEFVVVLDLV